MAKILVVEDEMLVRMLIVDTLEDGGHTILEAGDGEAALKLVEANPDLALIISDVRMPRIDGYEFGLAARQIMPGIPLVFTTGYAKSSAPPELGAVRMLQKPFDTDELLAIVTSMLG